jgi:hypothetical protein
MCTPQPVQAYRWMTADGSTTLSFWPFAVTLTFSRGVTATIENRAPEGFQHLVQPQTWLKATLPLIFTVTGASVHLQVNVPPLKSAVPEVTPPSTDG